MKLCILGTPKTQHQILLESNIINLVLDSNETGGKGLTGTSEDQAAISDLARVAAVAGT